MIALLLLSLAARDEAADLITKLRAASDVNQRYQLSNQLSSVVKPAILVHVFPLSDDTLTYKLDEKLESPLVRNSSV